MKRQKNKTIDIKSNNLRNLTDVKMAKQYYQYQIELQENALFYEFKELRQGFAESVKNTLRKLGTQLMIASAIKLLQSQLSRKRK